MQEYAKHFQIFFVTVSAIKFTLVKNFALFLSIFKFPNLRF